MPSDKPTANGACGTDNFPIPSIRVWDVLRRSSGAKGQGLFLIMGASPHTPSLGYKNGVVQGESSCGGHSLCEHVPTDKVIASVACGTGTFPIPSIRVWCVFRRSGGQGMCEHVLTDKPTASIACGTDRLRNPANRVQKA